MRVSVAPRTHLDAKQLLIVATVIVNILGQSPEISIEGGALWFLLTESLSGIYLPSPGGGNPSYNVVTLELWGSEL